MNKTTTAETLPNFYQGFAAATRQAKGIIPDVPRLNSELQRVGREKGHNSGFSSLGQVLRKLQCLACSASIHGRGLKGCRRGILQWRKEIQLSISAQPAGSPEPNGEVSMMPLYPIIEREHRCRTCLQLNLCLGDILLASTAACDLLGLRDLSTDSLGAEVLERVSLDGVDAQGGVGLNNGESTGNYKDSNV